MLKYFLIINFFLLGKSIQSFSQDVLTLEDAIRIGLENNYSIKIAQKDINILTNDISLGNAGFLPMIQGQATRSFTVENTELLFLDGRTQNVNNAASNLINANVILDWTIFNGMGMFITLERLNELKKSGQLNARIAVENTVAEIYNTYYLIVLERERLRVLENTMEVSNARVAIAKDLYEIGRTSKSEYLAAQVDLNADNSAFIQQQEIYNNAKTDLNAVLGRDPQIDYAVVDDIIVDNNLQLENLSQDLIVSNTNLQFAQTNRTVAELEIRELKAQRYPELHVVGGYRFNKSQAEAGFVLQNQSSGFNYGLMATINIFNGFNQTRQIQNARITSEVSQLEIESLKLQLNTELVKVYQSYKNKFELLELENQNLEIARENAAIALDRYKLGRSTSLEMREAQRNEVDAESRTLNAQYLVKIAEIELLRLTGNLLK